MTPRPRGRLLRQEAAEHEQLLQDKFNMALRMNYLEEQLLLLKDGEGFTETEVLTELAELHIALKAREDELRQRAFKWTQVVDDLEAQLEEAKVSPAGVQGRPQGQGDDAAPTSAEHYREMYSRLQEKLDVMTKQKQKALNDTNDLRRRVKKLSTDLDQQGKAMRDLKSDHEKALDSIYELETHIRQRNKQANESDKNVSLELDEEVRGVD